MTVEGLKTRIARRFSIIGPKYNFKVSVDGDEIGPEDRGYHQMLEYLWTYGDQKDFVKLCTKLSRTPEARLPVTTKSSFCATIREADWNVEVIWECEVIRQDNARTRIATLTRKLSKALNGNVRP